MSKNMEYDFKQIAILKQASKLADTILDQLDQCYSAHLKQVEASKAA